MKKNVQRILATILTVIMMISMLPSNVFAADFDADMFVEPAVEAVSVPAEEQEVESTVEEVPVEADEIAEDISVGDAEAVQGSSEEFETVDAADPAAADEIEETTEAPVVDDKITLKAEGKDYVVTVTYDASALLPDDVKVTAEEIKANAKKYDDYCDQALEAVQQENADVEELSYARLFDIKLVDAAGNVLEPASAVDVQIRLKDVETVEESTQIVHFAGEEEIPEVIEPTVENDTVAFATEGFSIYAVIGTNDKARLTVKFFGAKDETTGEYALIDTMYVKRADQASDETIKEIINDPGAGDVPANYSFYGWSIGNKDYAAEAGSTIDDVRDYVSTYNIPDGDEGVLEVYAIYVAHYTVKYLAKEEVNLKSDTVLVTKAGDSADYIVNMSYPSDSEHNFEGWMPTDHASNITDPAGATASTLFENGTPIKIKGDVTFSVSAPAGHWLVFHENGKNATFNAAQFVKAGDVTSAANLRPMERNGYQFVDWYLGAPSAEGEDPTGDRFEFGHEINETTDVYAKWNKNPTADYTVIIWKEGLEVGTYDYGEAVVIEDAPVDSPVAVSRTGSGDDAYAVINGVAYNGANKDEYKGFHLRAQNPIVPANTTVGPEGNTVVNVYYDRTEYTLEFVLNISIRNIAYPLIGPEYYSWNAVTYDTITARYGTYIGDQFPIAGSRFVQWLNSFPSYLQWAVAPLSEYLNSFHRWRPLNSETLKKVTVFLDTMPYENITFARDDENTTRLELNYYGEALPGEPVDRNWGGKDWTLINSNTARYNFYSKEEDFVEIIGFEKYTTDPGFDSNDENHTASRMDFYYLRKLAKITYLNGWAYDGNNARIEAIDGEIAQSADIRFGTNLSSYNKGEGNYFVPGPEKTPKGYVFEGWFVDKYCTKEFEFTTMPAGGITVYAKWREIQYRVFLRPNAGNDNTLTWGSDDQATNFRVGYGEKVSAPYGRRTTGYTFLGWFYDEAMTQPVYAANIVVDENNTIAYEKNKQVNFTDPSDKLGNANATSNADEGRWWIDKKLDLYAKWSKDPIGAEGISVVYDAGEYGTNAPSDTVLYQDNTTAVAGAAPTANDGKVFVKWVVQKWDKVEKKFVDTDVEKLPGEKFDVLIDNARIQDRDTEVDVDTTVSGGHYIYTIQVIAKYEDAEEKVPTHITWFKNNGSGEFYRKDNNLKINQAVSIYGLGEEGIPERDGYNFIGWAKENEYEEDGTTIRTSSNATEANFLKYENGKFYAKDDAGRDVEVTEVAADEVKPYEALYAIWEDIPHFTIYHSATKEKEVIYFTDVFPEGSTLDLTTAREGIYSGVTEDYLYGGFYHYSEEDGVATKGAAYTLEDGYGYGTEMTPKDGETYWLKEVSKEYLVPMVYVTWNTNPNYNPLNMLRAMWLMTDIDDTSYSDYGVIITGDVERTISWTGKFTGFEVTQKNKDGEQSTETWSVKKIWTATEGGYLGASDISEYATNADYKNKNLVLTAYFVTPDSVKVTGIKRMTYNMGNQTMQGWKSPGIYRLPKEEIASTCEKVTRSLIASGIESVKGTYKAQVASETINYTVTKVDNGKNVAQEVEAGDNTGKITYAGKKNYVFAGWYLDKAYTKAADFSAVTGDMTVYAKYLKVSDIALGFTKKSSKSGSVTLKATLKIIGAPDLTDAAVTCDYKGKTSAVKFTGVKTRKSGNTTVSTYTGTVAISNLANKSSFTAAVSYKTPDGTTVSVSDKTCKYASGTVTVK